jgi:hypothetical protein
MRRPHSASAARESALLPSTKVRLICSPWPAMMTCVTPGAVIATFWLDRLPLSTLSRISAERSVDLIGLEHQIAAPLHDAEAQLRGQRDLLQQGAQHRESGSLLV